jgi:hypothetical protein
MEISTANNRIWFGLLFFSIVLFCFAAIDAARVETPTVDEFAHVPAGTVYLKYGLFSHFAKNPPLQKMLMALPIVLHKESKISKPKEITQGWGPWIHGYSFMKLNSANYFFYFFLARLLVIAEVLLAAILLFSWARQIVNIKAAAISTSLFLMSPLVLAHAHLATIDMGCMLTIFLTAYIFRWTYKNPTFKKIFLIGFFWGIALSVKYTAVLLFPVFLFQIAFLRKGRPALFFKELTLICLSAIFFVNILMGFNGSFSPLGEYPFVSTFCKSVQNILPPWIPVPLPTAYVMGFDVLKQDTEAGEFGSYLLGEWSQKGWWYYNFVAFGVKEPLPFLIILAFIPLILYRHKAEKGEFVFVLVPLFVLFLIMTFMNKITIGIRYILPVYPFLFLLTSYFWNWDKSKFVNIFSILTITYYAINIFLTHPAYLSFFNIIGGGSKNGHKYLLDSNIDWGQDLYRLPDALKELNYNGKIGLLYFGYVHPNLYGFDYEIVPATPIKTVFAVSINYVMGYPYPATDSNGRLVPIASNHLRWLKDYEPIKKLGSIWLYDTRDK